MNNKNLKLKSGTTSVPSQLKIISHWQYLNRSIVEGCGIASEDKARVNELMAYVYQNDRPLLCYSKGLSARSSNDSYRNRRQEFVSQLLHGSVYVFVLYCSDRQ